MAERASKITAVVLAAGRSERMGSNKLLADLGGKPMIRHSVEMLLASNVYDVIVVTGNEDENVREALQSLDVAFVHNAKFAEGLSTSLKAGLNAVSLDADGALICLGDMPLIEARTIDQLVCSFDESSHRTICVPTCDGVRGNPVLWGRQHFKALESIEGDQGGKRVMDLRGNEIFEVVVQSKGVLLDVDTPSDLQEIKSILKP
jgi:molybdenum cofactor cytidylyltransferase